MSVPRVVAVAPGSPAARAGLTVGDEIVAVNGERPRDVIAWRLLTDLADLVLDVDRGGLTSALEVAKRDGEPLGVEVHSALFDRVQTCDNHCEFCFIYQLPPGLRPSLYLKDDDYRLSFLYGNFTTLTRFTEADLERVVTERLGPLNVSLHATDPDVRASMLRNRRGATSLRWLRALLDHGIAVHGQVVVCPGVNDGVVLEDTLAGVLDQYPELASICVVPLGVSRWSDEARMRPHTEQEAAAVIDCVEDWQGVYQRVLGRRLAFAADEYYLVAQRAFPRAETYGDFAMHEDGIGMARTFEAEFLGTPGRYPAPAPAPAPAAVAGAGPKAGFFAWVDAGDQPYETYRGSRHDGASAVNVTLGHAFARAEPRRATTGARKAVEAPAVEGTAAGPVVVLTGTYGAAVLAPLVASLGRDDIEVLAVANEFFGGNIGVTGLLVGQDVARALAGQPRGRRYLLPDVCLSNGRFLDGTSPADLGGHVEVIATNGVALRRALDERARGGLMAEAAARSVPRPVAARG